MLFLGMDSLLEMIYLEGLSFNAFIDRLKIGRWLRLGHAKQVDNLLFNVKQPLFHSWHASRIRFLREMLGLCSSTSKFVFDGLELEAVESLDVVLSKVFKFSFSSNTNR